MHEDDGPSGSLQPNGLDVTALELLQWQSNFGSAVPGLADGGDRGPRRRDLLPVPQLEDLQACEGLKVQIPQLLGARWLNGVIAALNILHGSTKCLVTGIPAAAQRYVIRDIFCKLDRLYVRLLGVTSDAGSFTQQSFLRMTGQDESSDSGHLFAERFDLLEHSGRVDPLNFVPPGFKAVLSSPQSLFANASAGLDRYAHVRKEHRKQYVALVVLWSCSFLQGRWDSLFQ